MSDSIDYMIRSNIARTLIECRREKDVTQAELAKALGLKPTTIASWEQGKSLPNVQTLYRIANYYKKTIGYMYGERDK